jgi:hypothetical protein
MSPRRSQPYRFSAPIPVSAPIVHSTLAINSLYLKLLHHYTTVTSHTLSADPLLRTLWRTEVPRLAFDHDFLMRGLFAVSAVHLSRLSPQKKDYYLSIATHEHQVALPEACSLLSDITSDNCSPLYAFSMLTFIYTWASPRQADDIPLLRNMSGSEWLGLFRGIRSIGEMARNDLFNGPIAPFIRLGAQRIEHMAAPLRSSTWWASTPEYAQLGQLRQHLISAIADRHLFDVYMTSVDDLETSFCSLALSNNDVHLNEDVLGKPGDLCLPRSRLPEVGTVGSWLYKVSDEYLELLSSAEREALIIFAHFCVVIKSLDAYWWMQGWSEHLLGAIWHLLQPEDRLWIRWPMEEIGWIGEDMV